MFEATGWVLDESWTHDQTTIEEARVYPESNPEYILSIGKWFDFNSDAMRMSAVVWSLKSNAVYAYVKGSPEWITELCEKNSIPDDFDQVLE